MTSKIFTRVEIIDLKEPISTRRKNSWKGFGNDFRNVIVTRIENYEKPDVTNQFRESLSRDRIKFRLLPKNSDVSY